MSVKQSIKVTNAGLSPILSVAQGTSAIEYEFTVSDFDIPSGSAAVAYNIQPTGNIVSQTCSISGNTITVKPPAYYFLRGKNYMQFQVSRSNEDLFSFLIEVWCAQNISQPEVIVAENPSLVSQLISDVRLLSSQLDNLLSIPSGSLSTSADAALADIKVGWDGTTYDTPGDAVRGQIGPLSEDIDYLKSNKYTVNTSFSDNTDLEIIDTAQITAQTSRYFVNKEKSISKGNIISSLSVLVSKHPTNACTYEIEIWDLDGTALTRKYVKQFVTELSGIPNTVVKELQKVSFQYVCTGETYISVRLVSAESSSASFVSIASKADGKTYRIANVSDLSLDTSEFLFINNYVPVYSIEMHTEKAVVAKSYVVVRKDGKGDFTSLVDAINSIPEGTPIIVHEGTYEGTLECSNKKINIRGVDRNKCIIRSTNGLYAKPAINISVGYLENLTIYSQYVKGESSEIQDGVQMAYGIHAESEYAVGGTLELHHCTVKSDFTSAFGLGLRKDNTVILDDCILENAQYKAKSNYPNGLGALYFHDSIGVGGDSHLIVKNCLLKSRLGYSLCPYMANQPTSGTNHVYTTFINNVLHDAINGYADNIYFRNDPYGENGNFTMEIGYGNSNPDLNF